MKKILISVLSVILLPCWALTHEGTGDYLRETGKIYVVVAVILSIFAGLFIFMWWMDRRITRIEKQINPS